MTPVATYSSTPSASASSLASVVGHGAVAVQTTQTRLVAENGDDRGSAILRQLVQLAP